jgi:hypothetical protein
LFLTLEAFPDGVLIVEGIDWFGFLGVVGLDAWAWMRVLCVVANGHGCCFSAWFTKAYWMEKRGYVTACGILDKHGMFGKAVAKA